MRALRTSQYRPRRPAGLSHFLRAIVLVVACSALFAGCYSAQDIRERSELVEDPRTQEMKKLWEALEGTLLEAGYTIKLNRPQDKLITTEWIPSAEGLRRRVRMTLVVTNMGIGMNATVVYERESGEVWEKVEGDPVLARAAKTEEQLLVRAAYAKWTGEELAP